jgi:hypothetical protein
MHHLTQSEKIPSRQEGLSVSIPINDRFFFEHEFPKIESEVDDKKSKQNLAEKIANPLKRKFD